MFLSDRRDTKWIPTRRCQDHSRNKPALTTGRWGDGREGSTFMGLAKRMDKIKKWPSTTVMQEIQTYRNAGFT